MKLLLLCSSSCGFKKRAHKAGLNVNALIAEIRIAIERVNPNCLKNIPEVPPIKLTGINTADITSVMDIIAGAISFKAVIVATFGSFSPASSCACTASTTTMASSTTIPIANTRANSVNRFIENPNTCKKKNVPIMATGTAIAGIRVDLISCKNTNTTINTNIKASINVWITFSIDASKNSLESII